jgi:hypothetical protein
VSHFLVRWSGYVSDAPLGFSFNGSLWLCWQLQNCGLLALTQCCQEHDPTIRKFQRIVMRAILPLLICRKIAVLCSTTLPRQTIKPVGKHLTSCAKDSSYPEGRRRLFRCPSASTKCELTNVVNIAAGDLSLHMRRPNCAHRPPHSQH